MVVTLLIMAEPSAQACTARAEGHVTLAWGRDFGDVSPLRGILFGGSKHKLSVDVRVQPLD
jgi:hypothetical protein